MERNSKIDIIRGLLIVFVVIGHYAVGGIHDFIFLFHMPLFFMISGVLLKREHLVKKDWITNRIRNFMIPYVVYLFADLFLVRHDYSIGLIVRALWGGRAISGVYWYVTCYIFTLLVLFFMIKRLSDKMVKTLILVGGIAVLESHLIDKIHILCSPGIPWNLDAALMALVYVGIGFFYKKHIIGLFEEKSTKYDMMACLTALGLAVFCWHIYKDGSRLYYFDMKPIYYKDFVLAIFIPCAFGVVLVRLVHWLDEIKLLSKLNGFLRLCGQTTIPIMFMHVPLNHLKDSIGYGRIIYLIVGIAIPLAITIMLNNIPLACKLLGLPQINFKSQ